MVKRIKRNWQRMSVAEQRRLIVWAVEEVILGILFFAAFALGMHALSLLVDAWMGWCCG